MSDFKSKLPDLKEMTSMATKFYKDMKESVCEIIKDYKDKRGETASNETITPKAKPKPTAEEIKPEVVVKTTTKKAPKSEDKENPPL